MTGDSAKKGLTVKGAAAQSANLQEWQNSSGTVYSYIGPKHEAYFKPSNNGTVALTVYGGGGGGNTAAFYNATGTTSVIVDAGGFLNITSASSTVQIQTGLTRYITPVSAYGASSYE